MLWNLKKIMMGTETKAQTGKNLICISLPESTEDVLKHYNNCHNIVEKTLSLFKTQIKKRKLIAILFSENNIYAKELVETFEEYYPQYGTLGFKNKESFNFGIDVFFKTINDDEIILVLAPTSEINQFIKNTVSAKESQNVEANTS